ILDTPCALRSSSSTRSRNGRVPAFELLRRPTTRPSSVGRRLANGTAFPATAPTGASNSIVAISAIPSFLSPRQQLRGRGIFESLEFEGVARRIGQEHDRLLVSPLAADPRLEEKLRPLTPETFGQSFPRRKVQDHTEVGQRNALLVGLDTASDRCGVASEVSDEMVPEEVEVHAGVGNEAFGTAEQATEARARFADVAAGECHVQ